MKKPVFLLCLILVTVASSCTRGKVMEKLSDIESFIDARPDSALAAIRSIDTLQLRTRQERAKFALLHAMALDKNYIDTADTRVVMPAVEYYEKHGSPEEKMKAYMYQGVEQYNAGYYNQAIVSFYDAAEDAHNIKDFNLLGILYSRIADTYTMTKDHALAADYIDKSLECFRLCGRTDQANREKLRKAGNLTQRRKWKEANSYFLDLISDTTIEQIVRNNAKLDYSMFLVASPSQNDSLAYSYLATALRHGGVLRSPSQFYACSYLLKSAGMYNAADSILNILATSGVSAPYDYYYWSHRNKLRENDYKGAYQDLWLAMHSYDSLINLSYALSAARSQESFVEHRLSENKLKLQNHKLLEVVILFFCFALFLGFYVLYLLLQKRKQKLESEQEQMNMVIDNLREQLVAIKNRKDGKSQNHYYDKKQAYFAFLGEIYEAAYIHSKDDIEAENYIKEFLRSKIGNLRSDPSARAVFENMIDKELDGIMTRFRRDFPNLSEREYNMAGYYFAGFDNTTVTIIMDISTLDNTRAQKSRLKRKILDSSGNNKELYAQLLS